MHRQITFYKIITEIEWFESGILENKVKMSTSQLKITNPLKTS